MPQEHPGLKPDDLGRLLASAGVEVVGDLRIELISGGRSNLTFEVRDDVHHCGPPPADGD